MQWIPLKDVDSRVFTRMSHGKKNKPSDLDLWQSIGFQTLLRTKYVPSLVKIHWRMLILECSQGCYAITIWPGDLDLWPWKSIGFQILLRTKYVPSLVKIHWRMLILECSQGFQWILTKLGTYVVLRRVWNPIDFQGQRSMSPGQIFTA
jgi:hypothetical protein